MSDDTSKNDDGEETVILARMTDGVEAGTLAELLASEGIPVATPGLEHRSLFGMAGGFVDIVVRVPKKDLARAKELQESLRASTPVEKSDETPEEKPRTDRLRRVAVFTSIWLPFGGGHFYARRWSAGFAFLALQIMTLVLAFEWPLFWYAMPFTALADMFGAVGLIRADQRGLRPIFPVQLAPLVAVLVVSTIPMARAFAPALLAGPAMTRACERAAECEGGQAIGECISHAADRTFAGLGSRAQDVACAECLDESLCEDIRFDCSECDGLVHLPAPAARASEGPRDTSADDMVHVIPTLFREEHDAVPAADLDAILRAMEDLPPPSATPLAPAPP